MSLTPAFLDELRARTLLSALVGKSIKLQRAGREWRACCPFHNEKTPSFYVNDDKGFYHCFGCSAHGDAIRWMTDQCGLPFIDAVKELAQAAGLEMPEQDRRDVEKEERAKGLHEAMQAANEWFEGQLGGLGGGEAQALLKRRGISDATRRMFNLGFAPDSRGKLRTALKDFGDPALIEAGLLIKVENKDPYDRFRGRLMIPIRDPRGRVIAFGGRVVGDGEPKYLNSPDTPLFDKGRTLYNLDRAQAAARKSGRVIAVEGYMDVISLAQAGFGEVVAPLGTALTEHQIERLWRMADVPLLCFDGDTAGQKAAIRAAHRALPMLQPGRSLAFVTLPEGMDPDDLVRSHGPQAFEALLGEAKPLVEQLWQSEVSAGDLNTPEERTALGVRLRALAQTIQEPDLRKEYLATFNRMIWDFFHPEKPSKSYTRLQEVNGLLKVTADRLIAIAKHGIAQTVFVPALVAGFLRHPHMIRRLAEVFADVTINSIPLRQVRERMLIAALDDPDLDAAKLRAILKADALGPIIAKLDKVTLAFSFIRTDSDPTQAGHDLAAVADKLVVGPRLDAEIQRSRDRWESDFQDSDYARYEAMFKYRHSVDEAFKEAMRPIDELV